MKKEMNKTREGKFLVMEEGGCPIHVGLKTHNPKRLKGCIFGDTKCIVDLIWSVIRQGLCKNSIQHLLSDS